MNSDPVRDEFIARMNAEILAFARDHPDLDQALIVRWIIQYGCELHARAYGHGATYKALVETARRGIRAAVEEQTAPRH